MEECPLDVLEENDTLIRHACEQAGLDPEVKTVAEAAELYVHLVDELGVLE